MLAVRTGTRLAGLVLVMLVLLTASIVWSKANPAEFMPTCCTSHVYTAPFVILNPHLALWARFGGALNQFFGLSIALGLIFAPLVILLTCETAMHSSRQRATGTVRIDACQPLALLTHHDHIAIINNLTTTTPRPGTPKEVGYVTQIFVTGEDLPTFKQHWRKTATSVCLRYQTPATNYRTAHGLF